jgi:type II secretory pathway pseudopilin PulG
MKGAGDAVTAADSRRCAACVRAGRWSTGFTYIALLLLVAMMSVSLAVVAQVWHTEQKRAKEEELLYVGNQIRRALALYGASAPGGGERYPRRLEDLTKDPRYPDVRRYLRKVYRDPITGSAEWGLVKAGDYITGVYSLSEEEPIKKVGFPPVDQGFEEQTKYSAWVFSPRIGQVRSGTLPAGSAGAEKFREQQPGTLRFRSNR